MKPLILYKFDESPPARAAMMVGHILGLPFEYHDVSLAEQEHLQPEYVDKNPMHTIPLLVDRGFVVADSHAIATYLITKYGADKRSTLYPNDVHDRATIDSRLHFDTGVLFARMRILFKKMLRGELKQIIQEHIDDIEEVYQMTELYLNKTTYLACDHFTVADICAGATITTLNVVIPIDAEKFPKLINWIGNLYVESCFQEVNMPGIEKINVLFNQLMGAPSGTEEGAQALGR